MDDLFTLADRAEAAEAAAAKAAEPPAPELAPAEGGLGDAEAVVTIDPALARRQALADPASIHPSLWRASQLARPVGRTEPSGHGALDAELPGGGWPEGALTELILKEPGAGELTLLRPALAAAATRNKPIWLVGCPLAPNAAELARDGLANNVRWIKVENQADALWACETILRSNALGALVAWLPRARPEAIRRLQGLAAATDALAFAVRTPAAAGEASAAALRLALAPAPGGALRIEILKRRGPAASAPVSLSLPRPAWLAEAQELRAGQATETPRPAARPETMERPAEGQLAERRRALVSTD